MRRWAPPALLLLALLLIPVPGASAASCTVAASGAWAAAGTWSGCGGGTPGAADDVVIPAGKSVSVADGDTRSADALTIRGTLALGDQAELDTTDLAASGGTISGPQYAMLVVTVPTGEQATVDGAGLTVSSAYLNVTGDGTFAIAGPLALNDGGWIESDIDATWTGAAPWQLGGAPSSPASGFEVFGAQLTVSGATSAQLTSGGGDGVIQLDGGATLVKSDATTTDLELAVLIDTARITVTAGKLIGQFQGAGSLAIAAGATLGLSGDDVQVTPPDIDVDGGNLEVEPGARVTLALPGAPALRRLSVAAGATLDLTIDDGASGPVTESSPPDAIGDQTAVATDATLTIEGGGGTLALSSGDSLSGTGTLDGSVENGGGTVSPSGALHVTGDYSQGSGGTLAIDLRGAGDGDSLHIDGAATLAGTLTVRTTYAPAAGAAPLVLGASAKPGGTFTKTLAPVGSQAWTPSYTAAGVVLGRAAGGGGAAAAQSSKPTLVPALPVIGGLTRCVPGTWPGTHGQSFQWLRAGKPIANATAARYRPAPADRGRALSCRVTVTTAAGTHASAISKRARVRTGLRIGAVTVTSGGDVTVALRCASSEGRCSGSLRVLVAGHAVAGGHFALHAPGGVVQLAPVGSGPANGAAVVRASYRNGKGAARNVDRRFALHA